jgi:regulator of protease activity HflC (stomatin/prohibitin superfamily)
MTNNQIISLVKWGVVALIVLIALWSTVTLVGAGEQAVITRLGAVRGNTLGAGLHFIVPFVEKAIIFDIREQKEEVDAAAASKDLQSIKAKLALNYHLDPANINNLYREIGGGKQYRAKIIDPAIQESIKAATANFTAEELITKRSEVKERTKLNLTERLSHRYIILDDLSIVDFGFSPEFDKAIEGKQVAEQNALTAQRTLEQVKFEAQQSIEKAKAEAETLRLTSMQASPAVLQLETIKRWDGKLPTYMMGNTVPFVNLNK